MLVHHGWIIMITSVVQTDIVTDLLFCIQVRGYHLKSTPLVCVKTKDLSLVKTHLNTETQFVNYLL